MTDGNNIDICAACDSPRLCKLCLATDPEATKGPGEARDRITFATLAEYNGHLSEVHGRCPSCGEEHPVEAEVHQVDA